MDIAKFLDQPIRFNPRRPHASPMAESSLLPPSQSYESTRSTPSSTLSLSSEVDAIVTTKNSLMPTQQHASTSLRISSPLAQRQDHSLERSSSTTNTPDPPLKRLNLGRQRVRRKIAKAACLACQKRKKKCNGKRPACGACVSKKRPCAYSVEEGLSNQAARRKQLESCITILQLVRDAASGDCERILQDLRAPQTLDEAIKTFQKRWIYKYKN